MSSSSKRSRKLRALRKNVIIGKEVLFSAAFALISKQLSHQSTFYSFTTALKDYLCIQCFLGSISYKKLEYLDVITSPWELR